MFTAHAVSHPGNIRKINEDSWRMDLALGVFVVADGMGGHNAGEVASDMAVETILNFMRRTYEGDDVTWPFGIDPTLSFEGNRIMTAIRLGNRRVFKAAESRDEQLENGRPRERVGHRHRARRQAERGEHRRLGVRVERAAGHHVRVPQRHATLVARVPLERLELQRLVEQLEVRAEAADA